MPYEPYSPLGNDGTRPLAFVLALPLTVAAVLIAEALGASDEAVGMTIGLGFFIFFAAIIVIQNRNRSRPRGLGLRRKADGSWERH